jgi:3-hydroxymyristoyl/3-hydroxydecanoyl-(acyl carrier protein) dehydratase
MEFHGRSAEKLPTTLLHSVNESLEKQSNDSIVQSLNRQIAQSPDHSMTEFSLTSIQRILPHRYPFLLVDRVTEFVLGERIAGMKNFTVNEATLEGNFGRAAFVPTGILLEAVTQLGAILVLERPEMKGKIAFILQIPSAEMRRPVRYGESLRLEARVVRLKETLGELRGAAYVGKELVAEGRMRFAIADAAAVASGLGV